MPILVHGVPARTPSTWRDGCRSAREGYEKMKQRGLYQLYGFTLESELDLPEVLAAPTPAPPHARVRIGNVPPDGLPSGRRVGPFVWAAPGVLWLQVPEVARFLVTHGEEIVVDPHEGVDEDSLRVFLLGSALGSLLLQRGMVVLHGNAIGVGDECLVCVGPSGSGKSTLAAEFMRRGFPILADDVVPLDDECRVLPGFPRLKLWQDAATRLNLDTKGLRTIRPNLEKFNYPLSESHFGSEPIPLRWLYVLTSRPHGVLKADTVRGMDRLRPLRNNTYRFGFLDGMELRADHLKSCGRLANRAHVSVLTRPEHAAEPEEVVDFLLSDLDTHR
jgi:hypothetical protein